MMLALLRQVGRDVTTPSREEATPARQDVQRAFAGRNVEEYPEIRQLKRGKIRKSRRE